MRSIISALVFSLVAATGITAQADNVTCRDGSTSSVEGRGACSHHGGVAKHHTERKSARKHAEPRVERHAEARHDRVRTRSQPRTPEVDRTPREQNDPAEPSWFEKHFGHAHEANQPTAVCVDGEVSYASHHRGACSNHGGVSKWLD